MRSEPQICPDEKICDNCHQPLIIIKAEVDYVCSQCGVVLEEDRFVGQEQLLDRSNPKQSTGSNVGISYNMIGDSSDRRKSIGSKIDYERLQRIQTKSFFDPKKRMEDRFFREFKALNAKFGFNYNSQILCNECSKIYVQLPKRSHVRNPEKITRYCYYMYAKKQGQIITRSEIFPEISDDERFDDFLWKIQAKIHQSQINNQSIQNSVIARKGNISSKAIIRTLISKICADNKFDQSVYEKAVCVSNDATGKPRIRACASILIALQECKIHSKLSPAALATQFNFAASSIYNQINTLANVKGFVNFSAMKKAMKIKKPVTIAPTIKKTPSPIAVSISNAISSPIKPSVKATVFNFAKYSSSPVLNITQAISSTRVFGKSSNPIANPTTLSWIASFARKSPNKAFPKTLKHNHKSPNRYTNRSIKNLANSSIDDRMIYSSPRNTNNNHKSHPYNSSIDTQEKIYEKHSSDSLLYIKVRHKTPWNSIRPELVNGFSPPLMTQVRKPPRYLIYCRMGSEYPDMESFSTTIRKFSTINFGPPNKLLQNSKVNQVNTRIESG